MAQFWDMVLKLMNFNIHLYNIDFSFFQLFIFSCVAGILLYFIRGLIE